MKHLLLYFILLVFHLWSTPVYAQFAENIQVIGGTYHDHVVKIAHDKEDNRYVIGFIGPPDGSDDFSQYKGEIDFGTFKKELTRSFIAKFDKDNRCVWVRQGPKNMWNSYSDLVVDHAGFVYVTGYIQKSNFVLEKIDPHGNLVWEKNISLKIPG